MQFFSKVGRSGWQQLRMQFLRCCGLLLLPAHERRWTMANCSCCVCHCFLQLLPEHEIQMSKFSGFDCVQPTLLVNLLACRDKNKCCHQEKSDRRIWFGQGSSHPVEGDTSSETSELLCRSRLMEHIPWQLGSWFGGLSFPFCCDAHFYAAMQKRSACELFSLLPWLD